MEQRIEEGDPLLRLRCSIIPNLNTGIYNSTGIQIKQSTIIFIHNTDGGDKNYKKKRKKVQVHDRG